MPGSDAKRMPAPGARTTAPRSGARRHEHEQRRAGGAAVLDAVVLSRRRERGRARAHRGRLRPDADDHLALEDRVDLVGGVVAVRLLRLTGLEAVDVAEEAWRLEQVQLLHLRRVEAARVEALDRDRHARNIAA